SWFEKNQTLIIAAVVILAAVAVGADVIHGIVGHKHVHFDVEAWPGFYAVVGFISYVGLVLTAKQLRKVLARPADYYDDQPPLLAFDPTAASEVHHDDEDHGHGHDEHLHDDDLDDEELHELDEETP
ncbi:MAG: hypothetical protein AB8H86_07360, partial [Polyangiales bacterium]